MRSMLTALLVAMVVLVSLGCGPDRHLQRQESAVRARTCQSLLERKYRRPPPSISPTHWLEAVARTPELRAPGNQAEVVRECQRIGDNVFGPAGLARLAGVLENHGSGS